jgi:hypothetical protein
VHEQALSGVQLSATVGAALGVGTRRAHEVGVGVGVGVGGRKVAFLAPRVQVEAMATLQAAKGARKKGQRGRSPQVLRLCKRWWGLMAWTGRSYRRHRIATCGCRGKQSINCGRRRSQELGCWGYRRRMPRRVLFQEPHVGVMGHWSKTTSAAGYGPTSRRASLVQGGGR